MKYSVKDMRELKKDGFTNAEIAEQLGCSEELVKKKLARKKSVVKKAKKDLDVVEPVEPEVEPEVDSDDPEVKRNWMGFKKKDQS
jgi:ParB-like chromosome segregation protein Spo0J